MPTIEKNRKPKQLCYQSHGKADYIRKYIYNTKTWRAMRMSKLMENPICECCNSRLSTTVHHIYEISKGRDELEMQQLAFDYSNLQSLCEQCHIEKHHGKKGESLN